MADSQTREQALGRAWKAARQTDALATPMLAEVVCAIPACFDLLEIEALPRAFRGDSVIPAAPILPQAGPGAFRTARGKSGEWYDKDEQKMAL